MKIYEFNMNNCYQQQKCQKAFPSAGGRRCSVNNDIIHTLVCYYYFSLYHFTRSCKKTYNLKND